MCRAVPREASAEWASPGALGRFPTVQAHVSPPVHFGVTPVAKVQARHLFSDQPDNMMSGESSVPIRFLTGLHPIGMLSIERLTELSRLGYIERVGRDLDPFRVDRLVGRTVYLLSGKLALTDSQGKSVILDGGSEQARLPIGRGSVVAEARALTELELIRFDDELIDIMITWDQLAAVTTYETAAWAA
jgi:hypothetical protein